MPKNYWGYSKIQIIVYDNGFGGEIELLLSGIANISGSNIHLYRKSGNNVSGINVKQDKSGTVYISNYSLSNCSFYISILGNTTVKTMFTVSSISKEEYQNIEGQLIDVNTY